MEQLTFGAGPAGSRAAEAQVPLAPGYEIERDLDLLTATGARRVAGVDEVGRGAWAGPVTVCAVIVRPGSADRSSPRCIGTGSWLASATRSSRSRRTPDTPRPRTRKRWPSSVPTPYHRLSWSYLDDLPRWRHLKRPRPDVEGQLSLI